MIKGTPPQSGLLLLIHPSGESATERMTRIRLSKEPSGILQEAFLTVPNEQSGISCLQSVAQIPSKLCSRTLMQNHVYFLMQLEEIQTRSPWYSFWFYSWLQKKK